VGKLGGHLVGAIAALESFPVSLVSFACSGSQELEA